MLRGTRAALGPPPANGYILRLWRGEWAEYYASWSGRSTLLFDRNAYAFWGNLYLDMVIACAFTLLTAGLGVMLWRRPRRRIESDG
ncbi:MAG: hypothetical protein V4574_19080 [Pseudomonadota bacterium]